MTLVSFDFSESRHRQMEEQLFEWMKMRLYEKSRSLSLALGILDLQVGEETDTLGTDGWRLYVNGPWLRTAFLRDSEGLCELFLHVLCHCLLCHPFQAREMGRKEAGLLSEEEGEEAGLQISWEQEAWQLLDEILGRKGQKRQGLAAKTTDDHSLWRRKIPALEKAPPISGMGGEAGEGMGEGKSGKKPPLRETGEAFRQMHEQLLHQRQCWEQAQKGLQRLSGGSRRAGSRYRSVVQTLKLTQEKRHDYRSFLKRFSCLREEGGPDMEQFDYGFYFWGLAHYENIPLIEPLEYRERRKIEELVIVIDTSGSCGVEMVRMFLEETRNILKEEELFFRRFRLHILQCDNQVQKDDRIASQRELDAYLSCLQIKGGGGTDFRPAFARIEELRRRELYHLKGILYFTDGYGIYPKEMPDYHVVFVFLKYRYDDIDVPAWAEKLVLDAERPRGTV